MNYLFRAKTKEHSLWKYGQIITTSKIHHSGEKTLNVMKKDQQNENKQLSQTAVIYLITNLKLNKMYRKFRKKPVEIEAIQWNGNSNRMEIEKFVGRELKSELESETAYVAEKGAPIFSLLIETKEGTMKAFRGDWIIKEPFPTGDRDFYPCKNDIFINTYDAIL